MSALKTSEFCLAESGAALNKPLKTPPPYAIASVDHALRVAVMLQLEDRLTVSEVAERLGVARSTAHRLLAMLVYRDFAVQDENHLYRAGPVLELAAHSQSRVSSLRAVALPHLRRLVDLLGETANLAIRTGDTVRFIASAECRQALRVGSREGKACTNMRRPAGAENVRFCMPLIGIAGRISPCRTQMAHRVRAAPLARS